MQVCFLLPEEPDGRWVELSGKTSVDARDSHRRMVGFVRDIHEMKMKELEREGRQMRDPVTGFYRLKPGIEVLEKARRQEPEGLLVLIDIFHFAYIVKNYDLRGFDPGGICKDVSGCLRRDGRGGRHSHPGGFG